MVNKNELVEYVGASDPSYRWDLQASRRVQEGYLHHVWVVSQRWQSKPWTHRLDLYIPDTIASSNWAQLTIGSDAPSQYTVSHIDFDLACRLSIVCCHLYDVPNQPLFGDLREDELLAHTLTQYLETDDATWPLLFPMVKAAVRALDTIAAICREKGCPIPVRYVVHGASKRGWTSWLTAVADPRVGAIAPEVYDNLNLFAQMPHQVAVWEAYSEMIDEYTEQQLQDKMRTPRGHHLALTIDPYTYRNQLSMPKLLIHGLNDRYWATDALNLYWDDLLGDKHVVYAPNEPHNIANRTRIRPTYAAFLRAVASDTCLPGIGAYYSENDAALEVVVGASTPATGASIWTAASANQDFRGSTWVRRSLTAAADHKSFAGEVERPVSGSIAVVAEGLFDGPDQPYVLSTQVRVMNSVRD